ncbi:carbohydrate porin [Rhodanobacter ginsengisoli]|uniref:Carbohydrate porin n=1 Tax=Rhodanobacter ginsengisoli TaxID=418646 RepID=A0ABW0QL62_9GAMM
MKGFLIVLLGLATALTMDCANAGDAPGAIDAGGATTTSLSYDGATIFDLHGGRGRSSTYVGNLHLRSLVDLQRALGWADTSAFVDALWIHGGQPDRFVGDALGVSNLSAPPGAQIEELWLEHNFDPSGVSLLAGLYDLNSEFYRLQSGGLFLNSAFGIGPEFAQSGIEGPSIFPRTSLGVRVAWKPAARVVLRAAVLDGVPLIRTDQRLGAFRQDDGLLYVAELALLDRPGAGMANDPRTRIGRNAMLPAYRGKLAFGAWHYTTLFDRLDPALPPRNQRGASGFYAVGDRVVARDPSDPDRALSAFAQLGWGDADVFRFGKYLGAGLVVAGPLRGRGADEFGVALAIARNGSPYRRQQAPGSPATHAERTVELSYLAQITPRLAVQPDLQYVIHPGTDRSIPNAWVFTLRFEVSTGI